MGNDQAMNPRLIVVTLVMCMALIHASSIMHLTNAGMGAPDWPDSYGVIAADGGNTGMEAGEAGTAKQAIMPQGIADRVHRGVANILQLLIIAVAVMAFLKRKAPNPQPLLVPMLALFLSLVLAFLGAWYGSPLRYPWIMIVNLTGGFALLAMFWWLTLDHYGRGVADPERVRRLRPWAITGMVIILIQIFLGAWMDAYYASMACAGSQGCAFTDWSLADLFRGLNLMGRLATDDSGRVITDHAVAASIHMSHRIWAAVAFLYGDWLAFRAIFVGGKYRQLGVIILVILTLQLLLGLMMIKFEMPVAFVVAHTVMASLLVLSVLTLIHPRMSAGTGRQTG